MLIRNKVARSNIGRTRVIPVKLAGNDLTFSDKTYQEKIKELFNSSLVAYWPMNETSGAVAYDISGKVCNGVYANVDLANTTGPTKTRTMAPYFDGANDYCNIYSAPLVANFNGTEGTFLAWARVYDAAVWADATTRRITSLRADASNYVVVTRTAANNNIQTVYNAAGTTRIINTTVTAVGWFFIGITWSLSTNRTKSYYNGIQSGVTQTVGAWVNPLINTRTNLGADITTPANVWKGWLAHAMILSQEATPGQILSAYSWGI